jgi:lysophospholipase L1-like esterase
MTMSPVHLDVHGHGLAIVGFVLSASSAHHRPANGSLTPPIAIQLGGPTSRSTCTGPVGSASVGRVTSVRARRCVAGVALALTLVLAGCGSAATPSPPSQLVLVALGDSLAANPGETCPGCTPHVERYADALGAATGMPVVVRNQGRPSLRVEALLRDLRSSSSMRDTVASADAVIVAVGTSDAPWNITDDACDGEATAVEMVPWKLYTDACIATHVERFRPAFDGVFKRIVELRAGKPTILRTINLYNDWIGFEGGEVPPKAVEASVDYLDAWNAMICETATANGFACGDVARAFNGEKGRTASGDLLAADYIHPSDEGHERIAAVLVELGFAPLVD